MTRSALLVAALLLGACGRSAVPPAGAPSPGPEQPTHYEQDTQSAPAQQQPGYGGQGPSEATPVTPIGPFAEAPPLNLSDALAAFEQASTELSSGDPACNGACKAFASMQRAAERICELNGPADPGARCFKAKQRLDQARETVQRRCGSCET
jgi:hypothetical protein